MLEYLAKMGEGNGPKAYKEFIRNYLRPAYSAFAFADGGNLPDQIYHVLRCGLVHSFSLTPDKTGKRSGGRNESIIIAYNGEHLEKYPLKIDSPLYISPSHHQDAVWFVFPEFCNDIEAAIKRVFSAAQSDMDLRGRMEKHLTENPPVRRLAVSSRSQAASGSVHLRTR
jgi:hypothetical protein